MYSNCGGLTQATKDYWELSSIRNGTLDVPCTTERAIKVLQKLQGQIGPHRRVAHSINHLYWDIIEGKRKRKRINPPQNLVTLRRGTP
jgi:hypothetical protein